jgi:RimJ/RimL family protein N-acetyltransferase
MILVWLLPSHHRRGIMGSVLKTLIDEWMVPLANARVIKSSLFVGNEASAGVFRKNGFVLDVTVENGTLLPEWRGGGYKPIHVYKWERKP